MSPLWSPTAEDIASSHLDRFRREVGCRDYADLHRWSIEEREAFWRAVWRFAAVIGDPGSAPCADIDRMPGTRWFPDAELSFAENLMGRRDDGIAVIAGDESGARAQLTFSDLASQVGDVASFLARVGVGPGTRVAAVLPNRIEAVVAMLATASLGGIFSACSPDFGADAVVDRIGQIAPCVLIGCAGYDYGGKRFDCAARLSEIVERVPSIDHVLLVGGDRLEGTAWRCQVTEFQSLLSAGGAPRVLVRARFDSPLYVLYSSGTTGAPKCIVHGQGGTLLQHRKEHLLHCDLRRDERLLFFTTCGWMMWNWLVSALANGTTVCLYDGSPFHPDPGTLFRFVEEEGIQHLGVSPGLLSALAKADYRPRQRHDLSSLRSILSTGSPLPAASFEWTLGQVAPVRLSSITGGTDILGCFALGNPCAPVWAGEIQAPALGMDVAFLDDEGAPLPRGKGELACLRSFPSMPVRFWDDPGDRKYRAAYFERYPGAWHHGDFGEFTEHGGVVIHGRSDAVLNRGGVRIGTAEIYRQVESFPEVLECIAIGRERDHDIEVWLFVRLRPDVQWTTALELRVRAAIRAGASPRHVPDRILPVADIPRTRSGKLVEIAVREVVHGRPVRNVGSLANPESLEHFKAFAEST